MDILGQRTPGKGLCEVEEPDPNRDFKKVALELQKAKFDGILKPASINFRWATQNGKKDEYILFFDWITKMVNKAAEDPKVRPKIEHRLKNLQDLCTRITQIRQLELDERILADVQKEEKDGGFGLKPEEVVEKEKSKSDYSNQEYSSLNKDAVLAKIDDPARRAKLVKWLSEYGKEEEPTEGGPKKPKEPKTKVQLAAISHVKALKSWTNQLANVMRLRGEGCDTG